MNASIKTSCEPLHTAAYSNDVRWRIVWQREALDLSCYEIAQKLNIDVSTVYRVIRQFRVTGDVYIQTITPVKINYAV